MATRLEWRHLGTKSPARIVRQCNKSSHKSTKVVMDLDGDLQLKVGNDKCLKDALTEHDHEHGQVTVFVCCSKTLARASPLWKTMIYGPWKESRGSQAGNLDDWVVELPEDNVDAMTFVLNVIHSHFEQLPTIGSMINISQLYDITVLTDKYDLTKLLRPWANTWLLPLRAQYPHGWEPDDKHLQGDLERKLWVAWEMGDHNLLLNILKDIVLNYPVARSCDTWFNPTAWVVMTRDATVLSPDNLVDVAGEHCSTLLSRLFAPYAKVFSDLICLDRQTPILSMGLFGQTVSKPSTILYCKQMNRTCELLMLGSLVNGLSCAGFWPLPAAEDIHSFQTTVKVVVYKLKTIKLETLKGLFAKEGYSSSANTHRQCNPFKDAEATINATLTSVAVELTDAHIKHLKDRATKTGISNDIGTLAKPNV